MIHAFRSGAKLSKSSLSRRIFTGVRRAHARTSIMTYQPGGLRRTRATVRVPSSSSHPSASGGRQQLIQRRQQSGTASSAEEGIPAPSQEQLRILAVRAAVPMVGFGFMDNMIMINAGELIDVTIGVTFGLSTMTAAGFGQIFSDVGGITFGGTVDAWVARLKLKHHGLTMKQLNSKPARLASTLGGCAGVVVGCLLGMSCLLFLDTGRADRLKQSQKLDSIFRSVMDEGHKVVNAERCSLWMIDDAADELWTRAVTGVDGEIRVAASAGIVGAAVKNNTEIVLKDCYEDKRFNKEVDAEQGYHTQSMVCIPVTDSDGNVIGAVQMVNKMNEDGDITKDGFSVEDVKLVRMLSHHVSYFLKAVNDD